MLAFKSPFPSLPGPLLSGITNQDRAVGTGGAVCLGVQSIENANNDVTGGSSVYLLFIITMTRQFLIMSVIKYSFLKKDFGDLHLK